MILVPSKFILLLIVLWRFNKYLLVKINSFGLPQSNQSLTVKALKLFPLVVKFFKTVVS